MANWLSRFLGGGDDERDGPIAPTGADHDYRPHVCDRAHDWAVLSDGVDTMRIEAWGGRFRRGQVVHPLQWSLAAIPRLVARRDRGSTRTTST
jgi:hypothetical protein